MVARRYKKRKNAHKRASSVQSGSSNGSAARETNTLMAGARNSYGSRPQMAQTHQAGRESRTSDRSGQSGRTYISPPVTAENSLGWNWEHLNNNRLQLINREHFHFHYLFGLGMWFEEKKTCWEEVLQCCEGCMMIWLTSWGAGCAIVCSWIVNFITISWGFHSNLLQNCPGWCWTFGYGPDSRSNYRCCRTRTDLTRAQHAGVWLISMDFRSKQVLTFRTNGSGCGE